MHLSLLSDAFISDSLDDGGRSVLNPPGGAKGREHRDGLVRGLVFMAIAIMLLAVLMVSGLCRPDDSDPSQAAWSAQMAVGAMSGIAHRS